MKYGVITVISVEEYAKKEEKVIKEVVSVLGQPQRMRPYEKSAFSLHEQDTKERSTTKYME